MDEREATYDFVRLAEVAVQKFHCSVELKRFHPDLVPALYTANSDALLDRIVERVPINDVEAPHAAAND